MRFLLFITVMAFCGHLSLAASPNLTRRGFILGSAATAVIIAAGPVIQITPIESLSNAEALKVFDQMCENFLNHATNVWSQVLDLHTDPTTGFLKFDRPDWITTEVQMDTGSRISAQVRPIDRRVIERLQIELADIDHPTVGQVNRAIQLLTSREEKHADPSPKEIVYVVVPNVVEE